MTQNERPTWNAYFLGVAVAISQRADCSRRKVGAVVVVGNEIRGAGYNGAPAGDTRSCLAGQCPRASSSVLPGSSYDTGPGACIAVHAEANAILRSGGRGGCLGATLYCTDKPCEGCTKIIRAAGIAKVIWPEGEVNY